MNDKEKQRLIDETWKKIDDPVVESIPPEEEAAAVQAYYELHPEEQYWHEFDGDERTPAQIWARETSS